MIDRGRYSVLGVQISAVDYEAAVERIVRAAQEGRRCTTSALAVHGVMTGVLDARHRYRLNALDLVVPDGQPVRWALGVLHRVWLPDRVYGPQLMLRVLERASREGIPVYFYGSHQSTLDRLADRLLERFPALQIAGSEPSRFRQLSELEADELATRIRASGAGILFVGLGCPRQEVFAYEMGDETRLPILAVGAAFDFHAGTVRQAPPAAQRLGLEWAYRLWQEPRRLWRRYLYLNTGYVFAILFQRFGGFSGGSSEADRPRVAERFG